MKIGFVVAIAFILAVGYVVLAGGGTTQQVRAAEYNELTAAERRVILDDGTERAFTGKYHDHKGEGTYLCKQCDLPLFESDSKFDSGTGWPSFDDSIPGAIKEVPDGGRTEIECARCSGHIGHVFRGEQMTEKNTRHCANSISLNFLEATMEKRGIFAGGCFWGVEHLLQDVPGVLSVESGYIGGTTENPTYKEVCYEDTGHIEAVEVVFDESKVTYEEIAKMFFEIHDPTQKGRQGPDIGYQYSSAVFYLDEEQKEVAEKLIGILKDKGLDVVTDVRKASKFWPAEDYHQDYYELNGKTPYCHAYTKRF